MARATLNADSAGDVTAADSGDGADALDGAEGQLCRNQFGPVRPDAGGVCCCRADINREPRCDADGGAPSCPAGFVLHHDLECDPSWPGSPCTNPSNMDGG